LKSITFGGAEVSIDHLAPMQMGCSCPNIGRTLTIKVAFSHHCYTEGFDADKHERKQIIVRDGSGPRVFCPIRHDLSFRLPQIVRSIPNNRVYQTAQQRNYVYAIPLDIKGQIYEVFFMLQNAERVAGIDLRMTIESAYPVNAPLPLPKRPNAIRFTILAYKVLRREPVRFAAR